MLAGIPVPLPFCALPIPGPHSPFLWSSLHLLFLTIQAKGKALRVELHGRTRLGGVPLSLSPLVIASRPSRPSGTATKIAMTASATGQGYQFEAARTERERTNDQAVPGDREAGC